MRDTVLLLTCSSPTTIAGMATNMGQDRSVCWSWDNPVYTGAGITPICVGAPICGATTTSASLSRGTSRCHKAQGKVYSTAEPCLADQIPPTLLQDGDHFGCHFHVDHPQDIFLSHSSSPHPQRPWSCLPVVKNYMETACIHLPRLMSALNSSPASLVGCFRTIPLP